MSKKSIVEEIIGDYFPLTIPIQEKVSSIKDILKIINNTEVSSKK